MKREHKFRLSNIFVKIIRKRSLRFTQTSY